MTIKKRSQQQRRYFSVIVGKGCNADCPFCISADLIKNAQPLPIEKLQKSVQIAKQIFNSQVASVSGGGEPLLLARTDIARWQEMNNCLAGFVKRDLHSNMSFDPYTSLDNFTNLTISLWPDKQTTKEYMARDLHDQIIHNCLLRPKHLKLRVSAVLGRDWCTGIDSILQHVQLAKSLNAEQVTLREMQRPDYAQQGWMANRFLEQTKVEEWIEERFPVQETALRGSKTYLINRVKVCCYRYAEDNDQDFLFFRPDQSGEYGLFTDYLNDDCQLDISEYDLK